MRHSISKKTAGYTMIEMIIVLVLIGILGVTALVKIQAASQIDALASADVLRRDIARIQAIALKTGVPLRLNVGTETTDVCNNIASVTYTPSGSALPAANQACVRTTRPAYWASCLKIIAGTICPNTDKPVKDPVTGIDFKFPTDDASFRATENVSIAAFDGASASVSGMDFDSVGRPSAGASLIASNPARSFTLSAAGKTATVTVRPITGFAEVSY